MKSYMWLTPSAPAAIAILQCTADAALFDRGLPQAGRARFAVLQTVDDGQVDEVVVLRLDEERIEVHCHGGFGVRQAVSMALGGHGFTEAELPLDEDWQTCARLAHPAAVAAYHPGITIPDLWLRQPLVLLTGAANAGKSTLLNEWCGHQRALVSDIAGTTRDLVAAVTEYDGWRLRLIDSAGLRSNSDQIEQAGQELAQQARTWVDLVIYLQAPDDRQGPQPDDLLLHSKWDLYPDQRSTRGLVWSAPAFSTPQQSAQQLTALAAAVIERLGLRQSLPAGDDK